VVLGVFKWNLFFLLVARSFYSQWCGDKEDHQMEMWWGLIALKPLCHFLLFGVCVCVAIGHKMTVWQGSCQVRCARQKSRGAVTKGCATVKISSVVLVF
jgi:hypothetical protein